MSNKEVLGSGNGTEGGSPSQEGHTGPMQDRRLLASQSAKVPHEVTLDLSTIGGEFVVKTEAGLDISFPADTIIEAQAFFYQLSQASGWNPFSPLTELTIINEEGFTDLLKITRDGIEEGDRNKPVVFIAPDTVIGKPAALQTPNTKKYVVEWSASGIHEFFAESDEKAQEILEGLLDPNDGNPLPQAFVPEIVEIIFYQEGFAEFDHTHLEFGLDGVDLEEIDDPFAADPDDWDD